MPSRRILPLVVAAVLFPASVQAQPRDEEEGKKSLARGIEQYNSHDLEGAIISFRQSYAAWPTGEALRLLAIAELQANHPVESLKHFRRYAKDRNADPSFLKNDLPRYLARCEMLVGHMRIIAPAGVQVTLDNRLIQEVGQDGIVDVMPGEHVVAVRGQESARRVQVDATKTIEIDLRPPGTSEPRSGEPRRPDTSGWQPTEKRLWPPPTISIVLASVTGVALVTSGVFALLARSNDSERSDYAADHPGACSAPASPACEKWEDLGSSQRRNATISDIGLVTAGVTGIATLATWYFFRSESPSAPKTTLVPAMHPGGAGLSMTHNF